MITGIHHSFHAIELGLLADKSVGELPAANLGYGERGARWCMLAVYFKTKDARIKSIAIPGWRLLSVGDHGSSYLRY